MKRQQADREYRREMEFERKQAEAYQKRRAGPVQAPLPLTLAR